MSESIDARFYKGARSEMKNMFYANEVQKAVFAMGADKSSGHDGFHYSFFIENVGSHVDEHVTTTCLHTFIEIAFVNGLNYTWF